MRIGTLLLGLGLLACSASKAAYEDGNRAARRQDWDEAVVLYERAVMKSPENVEYRIALERAREEAARFHRAEARSSRRRIVEGHEPAPLERERLFGSAPVLDPSSSEPIHLKFAEETSLRTILEALGRLAGVNVLFDESFRDKRVTLELDGVTFEQALELVLSTHGLYYKVLTSSTVRIDPGVP